MNLKELQVIDTERTAFKRKMESFTGDKANLTDKQIDYLIGYIEGVYDHGYDEGYATQENEEKHYF